MAKRAAPMKKLGFLNSASPRELAEPVAAFHRGMNQVGYVEDQNVSVTYQWAKHDLNRLPELARKLVDAGVDVLAATGGLAPSQAAVEAAKKADKPVRVVFVGGFDPVQAKLVDNLTRPRGNATGVNTSTTESLPDRIKLTRDLLGSETKMALLVKPNTFVGTLERQKANGLPVLEASTEDEIKSRFAEAKRAGYTIIVGADAFFTGKRKLLVAQAKQNGVAAIYAWREYVEAGGLMSYGPSLTNAYRQAGVYVGQILDNPTVANPPVLQPTSVEYAINLKTAKALGIEIPKGVLARAAVVVD